MTRSAKLIAIPLLLAAAVACESVVSEDVATSSIYADLTAVTEGSGTRAAAVLRVGGQTSNTFVDLEGDDALTVAVGDTTTPLAEQSLGDLFSYTADLADDAAGTAFVFALERATLDSAPQSTAVLPEPFDLTAPTASAAFSRTADAIEITWVAGTEVSDEVVLAVTGECFVAWVYEIPGGGDPGTYTIPSNTLQSFEAQDDQACEAEVAVLRKRTGDLDPAFGGGRVYAGQRRTVGIRVDP